MTPATFTLAAYYSTGRTDIIMAVLAIVAIGWLAWEFRQDGKRQAEHKRSKDKA